MNLLQLELNSLGGNVSIEDFQNYKPTVTDASSVNIDGFNRLFTLKPPSSGLLVGLVMKIMRGLFLIDSIENFCYLILTNYYYAI